MLLWSKIWLELCKSNVPGPSFFPSWPHNCLLCGHHVTPRCWTGRNWWRPLKAGQGRGTGLPRWQFSEEVPLAATGEHAPGPTKVQEEAAKQTEAHGFVGLPKLLFTLVSKVAWRRYPRTWVTDVTLCSWPRPPPPCWSPRPPLSSSLVAQRNCRDLWCTI